MILGLATAALVSLATARPAASSAGMPARRSEMEAGLNSVPCNCGLAEELTPIQIQQAFLRTRLVTPRVFETPKGPFCKDVYGNSCVAKAPNDGTGTVRPLLDIAQDDALFREDAEKLKRFSASWKALGPKEKAEVSEQDYVAKAFFDSEGFAEKLKRNDRILQEAKADILTRFRKDLTPSQLAELEKRMSGIGTNTNYLSYPGLLFESTIHVGENFAWGGAAQRAIDSEYAIYFVLGDHGCVV